MKTIKTKFISIVSSAPRFLSGVDSKFQDKLDEELKKLQEKSCEIIDVKLSTSVSPLVYTALIIYRE